MDMDHDSRSGIYDKNRDTEIIKHVVVSDGNKNRFRIVLVANLVVLQWQGATRSAPQMNPQEESHWANHRRLLLFHEEFIAMFGDEFYQKVTGSSGPISGQIISKFTVGGANP